jgi:chromate reductase, NAD(P)H dehydrogenase (quinone)
MNVVAISGSLRAKSSNTALLRAAAQLAPPGLEVRLYERIDELPHFNPDLDAAAIPSVVEFSTVVKAADALLISSPEYAFGVSGVMKNALDWLVGGDAFVHKPFAFVSASPRATISREALIRTLTAMSGSLIDAASITLPLLGTNLDAGEIRDHPEHGPALRRAMREIATAISSLNSRRAD